MSSTLRPQTNLHRNGESAASARRLCLGFVAVLIAGANCHAEVAGVAAQAYAAVRAEAMSVPGNSSGRDVEALGIAPPSVLAIRSRVAETSTGLATSTELAGVGYRWWSSHGRTDVGFGVGTVGRVTVSPEMHAPVTMAASPATLSGAGPVMVVGWRYRVSNVSAVYADASRASLPGAEERVQYNAKLGMEWRAAKPQQLGFDPGTLGVQFDSGYRMSVRLRSGGVKLMLRSQF